MTCGVSLDARSATQEALTSQTPGTTLDMSGVKATHVLLGGAHRRARSTAVEQAEQCMPRTVTCAGHQFCSNREL